MSATKRASSIDSLTPGAQARRDLIEQTRHELSQLVKKCLPPDPLFQPSVRQLTSSPTAPRPIYPPARLIELEENELEEEEWPDTPTAPSPTVSPDASPVMYAVGSKKTFITKFQALTSSGTPGTAAFVASAQKTVSIQTTIHLPDRTNGWMQQKVFPNIQHPRGPSSRATVSHQRDRLF